MKKLLIGLAIAVAVVAAGAYFLFANLGSILKAAIEKVGSDATLAQVRVEKIDLSVSSGEGRIAGLTVGNPKGFATPSAFMLGEVALKVNVASLKSEVVRIEEISVVAPRVTYEHASGGSNLDALKANVARYAKAQGAGGDKASAGKTEKSDKEIKLIIDRLVVRDGQVAVSHSALKGKALAAKLPTVEIRDIGKAKGGATPAEVADEVIGKLSDAANKAAAADLEKAVGKTVEAVKDAVQSLPGALRGVLGGGKQQQ